MCDDDSFFRWRELHKSTVMTKTPFLLPIEARRKYDLREYLVAEVQTCFFFDLRNSQTLLFLIKCIHYDLPGVGEGRTQI